MLVGELKEHVNSLGFWRRKWEEAQPHSPSRTHGASLCLTETVFDGNLKMPCYSYVSKNEGDDFGH